MARKSGLQKSVLDLYKRSLEMIQTKPLVRSDRRPSIRERFLKTLASSGQTSCLLQVRSPPVPSSVSWRRPETEGRSVDRVSFEKRRETARELFFYGG
jgi:hypothetical protein